MKKHSKFLKENKILTLAIIILFVGIFANQAGIFSTTELNPSKFSEGGDFDVIVQKAEINTVFDVLNAWDRYEYDKKIGMEWTCFEKDLGGDLSRFYNKDCKKLVEANINGCVIKTEFVARKSGMSADTIVKTAQVTLMSGASGCKVQSMGNVLISEPGDYTISATTCVHSCPSGANDPTNGGCFYKSADVQVGEVEPDCDVGSVCKKQFDHYSCSGVSLYKVYKIYKYDSDCNCEYSTELTEFHEICDYQCSAGECKEKPDEPSCNIGTECDRVMGDLICKSGDVYREIEIHEYDSNCNCNFDKFIYNFKDSCNYGCENGQCKSQDTPTRCYSDSDCGWCGSNCVLIEAGQICPPVMPPENYDCGVCDLNTGTCYATIKDTPIPPEECFDLWWFDSENPYCDLKEFCGNYQYDGLRTFDTRTMCENALSEPPEPPFEINWLYVVLGMVVIIFGGVLYWYGKK